MKIPPTHIHLKKNAILYACHVPILIPHHWNAQVKSRTDADIQKDVITEVPTCAPKTWCSQIIIVPKEDDAQCCTIDQQHLNSQCLQETHNCPSSFQLVSQIPVNTFKTNIINNVDGYYVIPLDKDSQYLVLIIQKIQKGVNTERKSIHRLSKRCPN